MKQQAKICGHCKRGAGEDFVPAEAIGLFRGVEMESGPRGFRMNLCEGHRWMIIEDGGRADIIKAYDRDGWKLLYERRVEEYYAVKRAWGPNHTLTARAHELLVKAQDAAGLNPNHGEES